MWALYESLLRQRSRKPSPKERKWISDAIGVCGVEQVKEAVQGLAASEYHRQGGYTGIGYAIRPNRDETIDGRVTKMAAKAPRRGPSALKVLLADRSSEARDVIYGKISDVERAATSPSEMNTRIGEEAEEWLRRVAKLAVVSRDGGRFEWGRA